MTLIFIFLLLQVGKFELAEPLQTENFRDSWDVLKEVSCLQCNDITCILLITNHIISLCLIQRLKDTPKDTPIMTYCTVSNILSVDRSLIRVSTY